MRKFTLTLIVICAMIVGAPVVYGISTVDHDSASLAVNAPTIKSTPHGIEITINDGEARTFYIYSITGQIVKTIEISESATLDLPQGFYIVKCRDWSKKIIVK